jgi:hypothetical protein
MLIHLFQTAGTAPVSFVSSLLEDEEKLREQDVRDIKYTASSFYGGTHHPPIIPELFTEICLGIGGADTTAASLYAFFLAMVLSPGSQYSHAGIISFHLMNFPFQMSNGVRRQK